MQHVYDTVVQELSADPAKRFISVEMYVLISIIYICLYVYMFLILHHIYEEEGDGGEERERLLEEGDR